MACKGICEKYKASRTPIGRYAVGQKRCQICEIFIEWDGLHCPCCGYRLRLRPRNSKYKAKMRTMRTGDAITVTTVKQNKKTSIAVNK